GHTVSDAFSAQVQQPNPIIGLGATQRAGLLPGLQGAQGPPLLVIGYSAFEPAPIRARIGPRPKSLQQAWCGLTHANVPLVLSELASPCAVPSLVPGEIELATLHESSSMAEHKAILKRATSWLAHRFTESSHDAAEQIRGGRTSPDFQVGFERHARDQPKLWRDIPEHHCIDAAARPVIGIDRPAVIVKGKRVVADPAHHTFGCAVLHVIEGVDLQHTVITRPQKTDFLR